MAKVRAILPVAGNATRLRPITNHKAKALVEVAGKPVVEHILLNLARNGVEDLVLVVGHMKDSIIDWVQKHFGNRFVLSFVEQKELLGLGHAIHAARDYLKDEILIMLGDEILSRNYTQMIKNCSINQEIDAAVGTMIVDNPSHYGMLEVDSEGFVTRMVEKPKHFDGNLAIAGVYYFKRGEDLADALQILLRRKLQGEEYQLTDALQLMVEDGYKFTTFSVGEGYDCGRPESLLKSNIRMLINNHYVDSEAKLVDSTVIPPCHIGKNARIVNSILGPFVSVGADALVESSSLSNAIVEARSRVEFKESKYSIFSESASIELDDRKAVQIAALSAKLQQSGANPR